MGGHGFCCGRFGIILALATYAKHYRLNSILDVSEHILDEMLKYVPSDISINFANGLAGIGWGLEYLSQQDIIAIDTIEACKEIDDKMISHNYIQMSDNSIDHGTGGVLLYVLAHIQGNQSKMPFPHCFLEQLLFVINQWPEETPQHLKVLRQMFIDYLDGKSIRLEMSLKPFVHIGANSKCNWNDFSLRSGLAGRLVNSIYKETQKAK